MDRMTKIIIFIMILLCFIWIINDRNYNPNKTNIENCDTTYNIITLDSIRYNIKIKDSVIIKLKKELVYEMEKAINADDSTAVIQFKELASSN